MSGKKPLRRRAHGYFIPWTRKLFAGLVATGAVSLAASPFVDLSWFPTLAVALILPGVVGLVMAKTTAGIGEEIKGLIIQKADETMAVIRETSSDQVRAINGIRDAQRDMAATLVGAQRDMVGIQKDMAGTLAEIRDSQKGMAGTLAEIRDSQKGMAGTLAEIRDLLKKNRG